jgi:hypothetical protein
LDNFSVTIGAVNQPLKFSGLKTAMPQMLIIIKEQYYGHA